MKCLICNNNKTQYSTTLTHACGISIPIGIQHKICHDCFDESCITGVKNINTLQYDTQKLALKQQTEYLKRTFSLKRSDFLSYQEVFEVFRGMGFTESATLDAAEQRKKVKKITEGYKISNFNIPDGQNLGASTIVVFKKSDIDVFCAKYKKGAKWYAGKHELTQEVINDLFSIGYAKYNAKDKPEFCNNLLEQKRPCVKCGEVKGFTLFRKTNCNQWRCIDCERKYANQYYQENREQQRERSKAWRKNNRDKINEYKKRPDQKIYHNIRRRLKDFMKTQGANYSKEVGCTSAELKTHLESQFQDGMTWDNYGSGENGDHKDCWHIDHIIPLSAWDEYGEQNKSPNHYTNLQPLWATENLSKGASLQA